MSFLLGETREPKAKGKRRGASKGRGRGEPDMRTIQAGDLTDEQLAQISELVKRTVGINLHKGKRELIKARLIKRLRELKLPNYQAYLEYLQNDHSGEEFTCMLDVLSTNVTQFFREPDHLNYLSEKVRSLSNAPHQKKERKFRVWSAGCSSGEEPYSVAIILAENFKNSATWDVKILATDISTRMLAQAQQGTYLKARIQDVPPLVRGKYFKCVEGGPEPLYRIHDNLKRMVHFGRLNLMGPWPMHGPFDAILCRNVMIYFEKSVQERLINRFHDLLAPGGALFIGHSESLTGVKHRFRFVQPTIYEKV